MAGPAFLKHSLADGARRFLPPVTALAFLIGSICGQVQPDQGITKSDTKRSKPPAFVPYGRIHVLAIGISGYRKGALFGPLPQAEADAQAVAATLRDLYGYEVHPPLLGAAATQAAINSNLAAIKRVLGPNDVLIVFFAGHGASVGSGTDKKGFLLPVDYEPTGITDTKSWEQNAIDMQRLGSEAIGYPARHVLLIIDACYSGFFGSRSSGSAGRLDLDLILTQKSRLALTAGTELQSALEGDVTINGRHFVNSQFTTALLDGLKRNEPVSLRELALDIRRDVVTWTKGEMQPLVRDLAPDLHGEFVFIPKSSNAGGSILDSIIGVFRKRGLGGNTLDDFYKVLEAEDYRYSAQPAEYDKDWQEQFKRYSDNATLGDPVARAILSLCYTRGLGTPPNPAEAKRWALEAYYTREDHDPAALYALSRIYTEGIGTNKIEVLGAKLLDEAVAKDFPPAVVDRVEIRKDSDPPHLRSALQKLEAAHQDGYPTATIRLARIYSGSLPTIPPNPTRRLELLLPLAQKGNAKAQRELAVLYGLGQPPAVPKDSAQALKWMTSAAEQGNARAQYEMSLMYGRNAKDFGLAPDQKKSRQWAELSASQGLSDAQLTLFFIYKRGEGVAVDLDRARRYLEGARKDPANSFAITAEGDLYEEGVIYETNRVKAIRLFAQAAELNDVNGMSRLAFYYKQCYPHAFPNSNWASYCPTLPVSAGDGYFRALYWCARSALQGNSWAIDNVKDYSFTANFLQWVESTFSPSERVSVGDLLKLHVPRER